MVRTLLCFSGKGFLIMPMKKYLFITLLISIATISVAQKDELRNLDVMLENYTYPYPVKFIKINNQQQELKMAFMDVKPDNYNGRNIMLLHGKNFNGAYWENTIRALSAEGYRVIVPDQVGFGKSSKPLSYQYTFHQLSANTKSLLDSLQINKVTVLGHSMGGMLATRFALMYPEMTQKLVLENPIGLEDWKLKVPYKDVNWWYENELKSNYEGIKKYQVENYYDGKWNAEFDRWAKLLAGWTLNENYEVIAWNAALTYDMVFTQPVLYEFQHVTSPTLLIIGTRDKTAIGKPLVSEEVRKTMGDYKQLGKITQAKIPGSQLVEIDNIGHLPHIEAFDRFINPLLEFLKK